MKFTYQIYWERLGKAGAVEPFLLPLTLQFASVVEARALLEKIVAIEKVPAHSVTLTSEDGSISERWFQIDGSWRRKG
jgi:hypothetical protein